MRIYANRMFVCLPVVFLLVPPKVSQSAGGSSNTDAYTDTN